MTGSLQLSATRSRQRSASTMTKLSSLARRNKLKKAVLLIISTKPPRSISISLMSSAMASSTMRTRNAEKTEASRKINPTSSGTMDRARFLLSSRCWMMHQSILIGCSSRPRFALSRAHLDGASAPTQLSLISIRTVSFTYSRRHSPPKK